MTTGEALLAAVRANPGDATARLVYADWLQERGEAGDDERAELVRARVAIAGRPDPCALCLYQTAAARAYNLTTEGPFYCRVCGTLRSRVRELVTSLLTRFYAPPCRVCGETKPVICYPDDHSQTVCPDCCDGAEHPDGETGHQWDYDQWERGDVCRYCGIQRKYTEYAWDD